MNNLKLKSIAVLLILTALPVEAQLKKQDITTWPKASVSDFGCFLEKQFGHKDDKFNCGLKKYVNKGDPCLNTTEYYEGPKFPAKLAEKINAKIESVDLIWEHGLLQSVSLTLNAKYPEKEVRKLFKLAKTAQVDDCSKKNTCVTLTGFDHMGAGDSECPGGE